MNPPSCQNEKDQYDPISSCSPPNKRQRSLALNTRLYSTNSTSSLHEKSPTIEINSKFDRCQSCQRQETLLQTFPCPSLHQFCLNCIFQWTQKHVQSKTTPKCLDENCDYDLKLNDLRHIPIAVKDHQILIELIEQGKKTCTIYRLKCSKCYLYIDQAKFYLHCNECQGRDSTIPCEICFCPIFLCDYEQHMLMCNNDDNRTLTQFLFEHVQNPSTEAKVIKSFLCSWQKKHRRPIDIYEIIEEINQSQDLSEQICEKCQEKVLFDQLYFVNCIDHHSVCFGCYSQHVKNQKMNNEILTCLQCNYQLQDKDLAECKEFTAEEIRLLQEYQNRKVMESYYHLYGDEQILETNPPIQQAASSSSTNDDQARRLCELCSQQCPYGDIFLLHCNCKICYDCFAKEMQRQRATTNEILVCVFCRSSIKHNDLGNLRLCKEEINAIQVYQQDKLFQLEHAAHFIKDKSNQPTTSTNVNNDEDANADGDFDLLFLNQQQTLPKYWTLPMLTNFSRHTLDVQSTEYKFVSDRFFESWKNVDNYGYPFGNPFAPAPLPQPPLNVMTHILHRTPGFTAQTPLTLPSAPALPPPPPTRPMQNTTMTPVSNPQLRIPNFGLTQPVMAGLLTSNNNNNGPFLHQLPPGSASLGRSYYSPSTNSNTIGLPPGLVPSFLAPTSAPPPVPIASSSSGPVTASVGAPPPSSGLHPNFTQQQAFLARRRRHRVPPGPGNIPLPVGRPGSVSRLNGAPKIIQIERIQNQRWYKQYAAHELEFREKIGKNTQRWLFHGCDERASKNIELECFNRSYAGQHATSYGQGCYFAKDSTYSDNYAAPDAQGIRRMFLVRVLVGRTVQGNSSMRVAPPGYDTTGDGQTIFVTYHDSQAYAEYLISYQ